ncbi:RNA/RNP complex-1-interacting phosphatase-like [Convolutriloba macropyga]|uniref:RNA/RNP complex-1-interacting phosphatase-like n=1 Tax=Convolutriloba macropyga TaxID=536237 RepID=UPI003F52692E
MVRKIPERWEFYHAVGDRIGSFLPFKVPLKRNFMHTLKKPKRSCFKDVSFCWEELFSILRYKKVLMGLVIDLCNTDKYYETTHLAKSDRALLYQKLYCRGFDETPSDAVFEQFMYIVQAYQRNYSDLIGIHCTHGVNRTGFLICKYLILCEGWNPATAVNEFEARRGHTFDKRFYVDHLLTLSPEFRRSEKVSEVEKFELLPWNTPRLQCFEQLIPIIITPQFETKENHEKKFAPVVNIKNGDNCNSNITCASSSMPTVTNLVISSSYRTGDTKPSKLHSPTISKKQQSVSLSDSSSFAGPPKKKAKWKKGEHLKGKNAMGIQLLKVKSEENVSLSSSDTIVRKRSFSF